MNQNLKAALNQSARADPPDFRGGCAAQSAAITGRITRSRNPADRSEPGCASRAGFIQRCLNIWRGLIRLMLALGLLAAGAPAFAQQTYNCTIINSPITISFGALTIPRDLPAGMPIGPAVNSTVSVNCPQNYNFLYPNSYSFIVLPVLTTSTVSSVFNTSGISDVWETGTPGIGIRIVNTDSNIVISGGTGAPNGIDGLAGGIGVVSGNAFAPPVPAAATQNGPYQATFNIQYQLIKTASQVTAGSPVATQMFWWASNDLINGTHTSGQYLTSIGGGTTVAVSTCFVPAKVVNVTLAPLPVRKLNPVGTTGGDTSFQIPLQCDTGDTSTVHVTLTDATNPSNTSNQLTLASGSSASGVKLRILNPNTNLVVNFGPDSAEAGNLNQWRAGSAAGMSGIPLTAQYVSTGGPVTPGTVKGGATFTLSYQ